MPKTDTKYKTRVCIVPRLSGIGGMVSFQRKLMAGLAARGFEITHNIDEISSGSVLVVGGTRNIIGLWKARKRGARIVQRLNGMNWMHRVRSTGLRHYLRAEYGNINLNFIRNRIANGIVYQSQFARGWWNRTYGLVKIPNYVVYNGVDLLTFTPNNISTLPTGRLRVLVVEARLAGGYETGLENAVWLAKEIKKLLTFNQSPFADKFVELIVVGRVSEHLRTRWNNQYGVKIKWAGQVQPEQIPEINRSAHMLFSADINAACPNSVIEALACGTPVVAFDTGSIPELVSQQSGKVVPYGGNPWRLELPNIPILAEAAIEVFQRQAEFRAGARQHAEKAFSLDQMVDGYLEALSI